MTYKRRERPHLVRGKGGEALALSTAVSGLGQWGDGCFTLVQPLKRGNNFGARAWVRCNNEGSCRTHHPGSRLLSSLNKIAS